MIMFQYMNIKMKYEYKNIFFYILYSYDYKKTIEKNLVEMMRK